MKIIIAFIIFCILTLQGAVVHGQLFCRSLSMDTLLQQPLYRYETVEDTTSAFQWQLITNSDFTNYRKKYHERLDTSTRHVQITDSSLTVPLREGKRSFFCSPTVIHMYCGYIKELNLHVIDHTTASSAVETTWLMDHQTGKILYVESPFDNGAGVPHVSPDGRFLLFYANNTFHDNISFISLLEVKKDGKHFILNPIHSEVIETFYINDAVWVDGQSIALYVAQHTMNEETEEKTITEDFLQATWTISRK